MPIASSNILRVVCGMHLYQETIENVFHVRVTVSSDPGDSTVVDEIATYFDNAYANLLSAQPDVLVYDKISVWNVSTDTFLGDTTWPVIVDGDNAAANILPPQSAPLVLFNTNINRSQGRKFLPPFTSACADSIGSPTSPALTTMVNWAADILSGITGTGWSGVLGNWNPLLPRFAQWAYAVVRDMYATQRRRYYGKGA